MKRLAAAATILAAGIATASPALAGHDVHVGGQFVHVSPGFSFSVGFGTAAPYPYVYGAAPVYVAPPTYLAPPAYVVAPPRDLAPASYYQGLPVVVAPHACQTWRQTHYVWRGGHYYRHGGHGGGHGRGGHHHGRR